MAGQDNPSWVPLHGVSIGLAVLATAAVVLRIVCRRLIKAPLMMDDYTIMLALFFSYGEAATLIICGHFGMGRHIETLDDEMLLGFFKTFYAHQILWILSIVCIKASFLLFYRRLFTANARFKLASSIVIVVTAAWSVAALCVIVFQCIPIRANWTPKIPARCLNRVTAFISKSVIHIFLDLVLLVLPLFVVSTLNMDRRKKISVSIVFILAGFVCIASIVRLPYVVISFGNSDITYNAANIQIWSYIEICLGIVCACLPVMRPLFRLTYTGHLTTNHAARSSERSWTHKKSGGGGHFSKLGGSASHEEATTNLVTEVTVRPMSKHDEPDLELNAIQVKSDIKWHTTPA